MSDPLPPDSSGASDNAFFFAKTLQSEQETRELISEVLRAADPGAVYGDPQVHGDVTIITASELTAGLGCGFASGAGSGSDSGSGSGGGGGGGGFSGGRPVAVITVSDQGVTVEPIVDVTKLGIALFTTLGAMFLSWRAIRR